MDLGHDEGLDRAMGLWPRLGQWNWAVLGPWTGARQYALTRVKIYDDLKVDSPKIVLNPFQNYV